MMKLILLVFLLCANRYFAQQGSIELVFMKKILFFFDNYRFSFSFRFGTITANR